MQLDEVFEIGPTHLASYVDHPPADRRAHQDLEHVPQDQFLQLLAHRAPATTYALTYKPFINRS